jgi:hypothetical protein
MIEFLSETDAHRATLVIAKLDACGFRGALTGSLALEAQLQLHGQPTGRRPLNDLDFVVTDFASIPAAVAGHFLVHHVHPHAPPGKLLLQLVDPAQALRIDVFRQFGETLTRTVKLADVAAPMGILALEDLLARTLSSLLSALGRGETYEPKLSQAFRRLDGLGDSANLELAWRDHRQDAGEAYGDAVALVRRWLDERPALAVAQAYSVTVEHCAKCEDSAPFVRASPERILDLLGYW